MATTSSSRRSSRRAAIRLPRSALGALRCHGEQTFREFSGLDLQAHAVKNAGRADQQVNVIETQHGGHRAGILPDACTRASRRQSEAEDLA